MVRASSPFQRMLVAAFSMNWLTPKPPSFSMQREAARWPAGPWPPGFMRASMTRSAGTITAPCSTL